MVAPAAALTLTVTVFERLSVKPGALDELVRAGLLRPDFALEQVQPVVEFLGRPDAFREADIEELMRHDAHRRVRGAIREVRWG